MIAFRDCPLRFSCVSCGNLSAGSLIEMGEDLEMGEDQAIMAHSVKMLLCDDCKGELVRRILFRRGIENAEKQ